MGEALLYTVYGCGDEVFTSVVPTDWDDHPPSRAGEAVLLACRRHALGKGLCSQVKQLWEEVTRQCSNRGEESTDWIFFTSANIELHCERSRPSLNLL